MSQIGNKILFYLIIKPLSYMPFGLIFLFSDLTFFLTYYVVRYRREVVRENLTQAFPSLKESEIKKIEKGFYRHFTDFIFESIKTLSITEKEVLKHTSIKNPELLDQYYQENRNVLVVCGHYNNWELYALSLPKQLKHTPYSLYQPLKNQFFDRLLLNSRARNGMNLIKTNDIVTFFKTNNGNPKMIVVVNDQSPTNINKAHWNTFLNQDTGWNVGPEMLAKKYDYVVLFGHSKKVKRGTYEVEFRLISDESKQTDSHYITDTYTKMLEAIIQEKPEFWLWSHKRWKHKKPKA